VVKNTKKCKNNDMNLREGPDPIIGEAESFLAVLERVSRVAPLAKPVLVIGERGTGKELIAARLHYLSERWQRSFIKFNCAALNEELLESELFGHVAGAYTGATRPRVGRFELANNGTLFLDELAATSPRLQEKLLRVIEYGEFERLGSSETQRVDVRLIGAANQDLPSLARQGRFREDLLDRLSFDVITLPPLRQRPGDILLLAQKFAEGMARELGREYFAGFAPTAERQLQNHSWPGNVRELRNTVERAVYRLDSARQVVETVELDAFASPFRPESIMAETPVASSFPAANAPERKWPLEFKSAVEGYERELLMAALKEARFNQKRAAALLNLNYHQFRGALRKYEMLPGKAAHA
jgi:psp operon transcriptional activator